MPPAPVWALTTTGEGVSLLVVFHRLSPNACCSLMACRRSSVAPASARRCKVQLSRLQHGLHNLPHSNKHVDVFELMLGCSRLVGQLPSGLSAWPVPLVARRGRGKTCWQQGRLTGQGAKVPWWAGRALVVVGALAARARRNVAWAVAWVDRRRAWSSCVLGGGSHWQLVRTGFWRQTAVRLGAR